ncbi:MAG: SpoVA/SpoVAEb family sporulation membrane protein [Clostridiales bacterium]
MNAIKKVAYAFFCGGCLSIGAQGLFTLYNVLPFTVGAKVSLMLLTIGVLGAVAFLFNLYPKLEKHFGFGAIMPICGLSAAIAGGIAGELKKGATKKNAFKKGALPVIMVLVVGCCCSMVVGIIAKIIL